MTTDRAKSNDKKSSVKNSKKRISINHTNNSSKFKAIANL
jgi:hypothetical protein